MCQVRLVHETGQRIAAGKINITGFALERPIAAGVDLKHESREMSKNFKILQISHTGGLCVPSDADLAPQHASAKVLAELQKIREAW